MVLAATGAAGGDAAGAAATAGTPHVQPASSADLPAAPKSSSQSSCTASEGCTGQQPLGACSQSGGMQTPSTSFTTECLTVSPSSFDFPASGIEAPCDQQQQQMEHGAQPRLQACLTNGAAAHCGAAAAGSAAAASISDTAALHRAVLLLRQGNVVAMPTETVYGLAANALDAEAVSRIFAAKGRPADNPLIVHISSLSMLYSLYPPGWSLPAAYTAAVAALWPGPLTILLPRSPLVPDVVTAAQTTMAVRMPSHPVARALIHAAGFPLAAPSANSSGRPSPTTAAHVMNDLAGRVPLVLDGGTCRCGVESTVLDALRQPPAVLRPGGATYEQLRDLPGLEGLQVYRRDFVDSKLEEVPTTPGMKYRHYSPDAMVILIDCSSWSGASEDLAAAVRVQSQLQLQQLAAGGLRRLAVLRTTAPPGQAPGVIAGSGGDGGDDASVLEYVLGSLDEPQAVARELFSALRLVDELGLAAVVVEGVREQDEGLAVMNRLRKAASSVVRLGSEAGPC